MSHTYKLHQQTLKVHPSVYDPGHFVPMVTDSRDLYWSEHSTLYFVHSYIYNLSVNPVCQLTSMSAGQLG